MKKPRLAIISQTIRRDLEEPLRHFRRLEIIHFYHDASYGDMTADDFVTGTVNYRDTQDLRKKLIQAKPDIIQGPEIYASKVALKNAWLVYRLSRDKGIPYFFPVFENRPIGEKFGWLRGIVVQCLMKIYGSQARGIINLNLGAKSNLIAAGIDPKKITRLNWGTWGINTKEFRPAPTIKDKYPLILFIGRVSRAKGILDLIKAWPKIINRFPLSRLMIGGPISEEDTNLDHELKQLLNTDYVGLIKNVDLPALFQQAWLTVTPSVTVKTWEEQVGMVNLQSMACGTPVVTTRSGAIPEYVGLNNGAFLVNEHDPNGIADSINQLLGDAKMRDDASKKARNYVVRNYEVRDSIEKCEEYVLKLLG